ncbi:hypothetical protein, partial [Aeromonas allosaccharophila]
RPISICFVGKKLFLIFNKMFTISPWRDDMGLYLFWRIQEPVTERLCIYVICGERYLVRLLKIASSHHEGLIGGIAGSANPSDRNPSHPIFQTTSSLRHLAHNLARMAIPIQ